MDDLDVVAAIYEAMAAKDLERLIELISPDLVLDQDPALPWGGHFEGHEGFGRTHIDTVCAPGGGSASQVDSRNIVRQGLAAGFRQTSDGAACLGNESA